MWASFLGNLECDDVLTVSCRVWGEKFEISVDV